MTRRGGPPRGLLDEGRLTADERELWEEMWTDPADTEGPHFKLWAFGYICMLNLDGVPKVVAERIDELGGGNLYMEYLQNVRKARGR